MVPDRLSSYYATQVEMLVLSMLASTLILILASYVGSMASKLSSLGLTRLITTHLLGDLLMALLLVFFLSSYG